MRTSLFLTLALMPAALVAQAPTQTPAPAATPAPAPAPVKLAFAQTLKAQQPEIVQMLKAFYPEQALARAEALLPATPPAFDKSDLNAGRNCSIQFSGLARTYHLAARCAGDAGNWEKGLSYLVKAQEVDTENLAQTTAVVTPAIENWKEPVANATKALADGAARLAELTAKTTPLTPEEDTELKNFQVHQKNIANGKLVCSTLGEDITATKKELDAFGPMIKVMEKNIAEEKQEIETGSAAKEFKGSKEKYLAAALNKKNLESRQTKQEKLNFLYRLQFHCAGTPQADKVKDVIDHVRADEDPFPPAAKKGKKKKTS